ncbi:LysM peptidoglycan-binding domain-containing protein [Cohnella cholangitidis]|uniref:LysM peptidoglycan-binding domain-containing protein n=1 Tax=Cohnella cholangitidis TaxID=2598458 RepID=A0A7G5C3P0_9BACL|nr:LysM peptidoglycan-binding domain-containing protein [Cohnella cholangitidis]QMV43824.1 LysM peptidoglycan-binding domain-containing protein [Cohnella cholangitidis]
MKIHMVKQGDSLYSIAQKYGVTLEDIVKANPDISNPDAIEVGMKVKVPSRPQTTAEVIHHHVVKQGDTLWKLSKSWGIQLTDMIKANPQLKNPNALLTGEVVNIPKPAHGNDAANVNANGNPGQGKANTGVMPSTGAKADTSVQPQPTPAPAPVLVTPVAPIVPEPVPQPVPAPAPVQPIAEAKPIYGFEVHEHVELFKQYPVPAVQATVHKEIPHPDAVPYGYGHGYDAQQPAYADHAQRAGLRRATACLRGSCASGTRLRSATACLRGSVPKRVTATARNSLPTWIMPKRVTATAFSSRSSLLSEANWPGISAG